MKLENAHALLIGVGQDLPVTVNDAEAFYSLLSDSNRASYPTENITLLTNQNASKDNVINQLKILIEKLKSQDDATVVIFYSGHGGLFIGPNGDNLYYLLTHGYDLSNKNATMIEGELFSELINQINAKRLLVMLDCCHASGMISVKSSFHPRREQDLIIKSNKELITKLKDGHGKIYLTSCKDEEESIILPGSNLSLFTDIAIKALSGQASKGNDFVRAIEFLNYVMINVADQAEKVNHLQTPIINAAKNLTPDYYLCKVSSSFKDQDPESTIKGYADSNRYSTLLDVYKTGASEADILKQFPTGPMVESHLINESIITEFSRVIDRTKFLTIIDRANRLRIEADPLDISTTIINQFDLLNPQGVTAFEFWHDAFDEAGRNGPRMLAALLFSIPDSNFKAEVKEARNSLLSYLKTHE